MTQREKVLGMLKLGPVCGTQFLQNYIPRYAARILELRKAGHIIMTRRCQYHDHDSPQVVYELADQDQMTFSFEETERPRPRGMETVSW